MLQLAGSITLMLAVVVSAAVWAWTRGYPRPVREQEVDR